MSLDYVTVRQVAEELAGGDIQTVHRWIRYYRFLESEKLFSSRVIQRSEYERFKRERPDLKTKTT